MDMAERAFRQRDALAAALKQSRAQHIEDGMWETHPIIEMIDDALRSAVPSPDIKSAE